MVMDNDWLDATVQTSIYRVQKHVTTGVRRVVALRRFYGPYDRVKYQPPIQLPDDCQTDEQIRAYIGDL